MKYEKGLTWKSLQVESLSSQTVGERALTVQNAAVYAARLVD